jgi:hypothetical protein
LFNPSLPERDDPYDKTSVELAETLRLVQTVEPILTRRATLEIDTTASVEQVVSAILDHVEAAARPLNGPF